MALPLAMIEERKRERGGRREKERERENRMEEREPFNRRSFSVFFFLLTSLFPSRHEKKNAETKQQRPWPPTRRPSRLSASQVEGSSSRSSRSSSSRSSRSGLALPRFPRAPLPQPLLPAPLPLSLPAVAGRPGSGESPGTKRGKNGWPPSTSGRRSGAS